VALAINHGLGGPKRMPKGERDGQQVNIPAQAYDHIEGTKDTGVRALLVWHRLAQDFAAMRFRRRTELGSFSQERT